MRVRYLALFLALSVALSACSTSKKLTYMQDLIAGESFAVPEAPELIVKPGDRLRIVVSCKNPQLAMPFNMVGGVYSVTDAPDGGQNTTVKSDANRGYLVDREGNIDFPVLGSLHIADMTISGIKAMLKERLTGENLLKDPIITVDFANFQYTILGEVSSKGNHKVEENNINLIQAIAKAGDLSTAANYEDVKVIRTVNGAREVYSVNMYSKALYQSPAFHIQQNDVIYVKPRGSKWSQDGERALGLTTSILSFASIITNIGLIVFYYTR